jgi:predicted DNA-binding protein
MNELVFSLAPEMRERLEGLAAKMERSLEECVQLAVAEFVENWEDFTRTVDALASADEERPILRAVND